MVNRAPMAEMFEKSPLKSSLACTSDPHFGLRLLLRVGSWQQRKHELLNVDCRLRRKLAKSPNFLGKFSLRHLPEKF
jgi:hypothetical protein